MKALGYFTFKDLFHDRWRSLLTILSLSVVVVGYLLVASMAQAFVEFVKKSPTTNNLVIMATGSIDPMDSSLSQADLDTARETAPNDIARSFPTLFRHLGIAGKVLQVRAVPLEEMPAAMGLNLVAGQWPAAPRQVVISEGVAKLAGWKVGSPVYIYGTEFEVSGLVRDVENNYGAVWMTYDEGVRLFGTTHGFQIGYLALKPGANPESVRNELMANQQVSAFNVVYLENALNDGYNQINYNLLTLSSILTLISLLAITFGLYNATNLSLTERSHEFSLLHMIGFDLKTVRIFLLARTLVLTLAAYGLGWVFVAVFIHSQRLDTPIDLFFAPLVLKLTGETWLLGFGAVVIFAFFGVWFTSRRISSLNMFARGE